jgi:phospholipid/cholesterol/gamma-HCH transport system substrate-binding protein
MRRIAATFALLAAASLVFFGQAASGTGGNYEVRGIFDNGGFLVPGEQVRIAGANVGSVASVDVTNTTEAAHRDGKPDPGKAVVVMSIANAGFQDFRQDASCLIRPQSLLGEKYVDCQPTQPRAPGSTPPPPLKVIPDGQPGAGQRFLPLENNGKEVDLDLINNIMREPFADRFRLILNDLGAGLAARGHDLQAIIDRADPALRETDRVLAVLARQNHELSRLAVDSDTDLAPLVRERQHLSGFINNANTAAEATAERSQALEAGLQRFPGALRQLRLTMVKLRSFSEQATPVFAEFRAGGPAIARATRALGPFAHAATPSLITLGTAAQESKQPIVNSTPIVRNVRDLAKKAAPGSKVLAQLLASLRETGFYKQFTRFLFNTTGAINGFDKFGHFLRATLSETGCTASLRCPLQHRSRDGQGANEVVEGQYERHEGVRGEGPGGSGRVPEVPRQAPSPSCSAGIIWRRGPGGRERQRRRRPAARRPGRSGGWQRSFLDRRINRKPERPAVDRRRARPARHPDRPAAIVEPEPGSGPVTRRRAGVIASSPVLVGAITTLIVILAVFLAYNANNGLPFVPSYRISVQVPNASTLVRGNDVRIGGVRVGLVESIEPIQSPKTGAVHAKVDLKLDKSAEPVPKDSTVIVRSRSALGLKYLEIDKGTSSHGYPEGSTLPLTADHPKPVEIDQVLNTFDTPTRRAIQDNLVSFGDALAGRGPDLNAALGQFRPLLNRLDPVARNLASPSTGLERFIRALAATAAEVAPVAETQAQMFVSLDSTFGAFASVARPFIQQTISETPPTLDTLTRTAPRIRRFLGHSATLFADLRPGVRSLSENSPTIAAALETGANVLPGAPQLNAQLAPTAKALEAFALNPGVKGGVKRSTQFFDLLTPALRFVTPAQSVCNYGTLLARNAQDLLSLNDGMATSQRFLVMSAGQSDSFNGVNAPNSENGPSAAPANSSTFEGNNYLHANPYPNTASPGQPRECEAGNENFIPGRTVIGNDPGNQGIKKEGQK